MKKKISTILCLLIILSLCPLGAMADDAVPPLAAESYILINADNENNQLYLCDSMLAISNDRWLTAKCAIDENGIIGSKACSCNINDAIKLY